MPREPDVTPDGEPDIEPAHGPAHGSGIRPAEAMAIARAVASEAAELLDGARDKIARVDHKNNPRDLVTEWDHRSEALIRERLAARTPSIALLGEESSSTGDIVATAGDRWLIDPIDGTVNFVHGLPFFSISIGLERDGEPIAGVVHAPVLGWEFYACQGGGAFCNGEAMRVSETPTLEQSLLASGFPYDRATNPDNNFEEWGDFLRNAGACRRFGSASLDMCMVARGWLDGYWERRLSPWDVSAGAILVREAGGTVTAIDGSPFASTKGEALASNGAIHREMLDVLAAVRQRRAERR